MKRYIARISVSLWLAIAFTWGGAVFGQCTGSSELWKKIAALQSSGITPLQHLSILLKEESAIRACTYNNDSTHAFLLREIGRIYFTQGNYLDASRFVLNAINIVTAGSNKPFIKARDLAINYYYLALIYGALGYRGDEAAAYDSCAAISIRLKSIGVICLYSLYQCAEYYFDIGDYNRCIDYAAACQRLAKQFAEQDPVKNYQDAMQYISSCLVWEVNALLQLKKFELADSLLRTKVEEFKSGMSYNMGSIFMQLAQVQVNKRNGEKGLFYYRKAFDAEKKLGHSISCKTILNNIGYYIYYSNYKEYDKALLYFRMALTYDDKDSAQQLLNNIESLNVLENIANVFFSKHQYDSGFKYFDLAFRKLNVGSDQNVLLRISLNELGQQKKIGYLTGLILDEADACLIAYKSLGDKKFIAKAIDMYKLADKFLDRVKAEQSDVESKLFWRSDSRRLYERAIGACNEGGLVNDAFYFFEKSRAVLLNDQLNERRWINEKDIGRQTQTSLKINQLEREYSSLNTGDKRIPELQAEIFKTRQELYQVVNIIKSRNPLFFQSFLDTSKITLKAVQNTILNEYSALIEIFSGDSTAYTLLITAKSSNLFRINKKVFDSLSHLYTGLLSDNVKLNASYPEFLKISRLLYKTLIGEIEIPKGRIIISPDGQYFPFESLLCNDREPPMSFMVNDYAISYTYSARYLMNDFNFGSDRKKGKDFLGVAPVQFPAALRLSALNGSDQSLTVLKKYFTTADNLVFGNATKSNFLKLFSAYKVLQLYTHATDSSEIGVPMIQFSDSGLYLPDLYCEIKPATLLVVLSACETGKGKVYAGEGVFSFNREFASFGIPCSVSNLWSVDNESTYQLTEFFFANLAQGLPTDVAFQKARIKYMNHAGKERGMPYYWASSLVIGKNISINRQHGKYLFVLETLTIMVLVTGCFYLFFPRR